MNSHGKVQINILPTGVPDLDIVLNGGLPEYSFNVIAGAPGCGKTTLAHQIVFANASVERPALYFTVLGEPSIKMLRYQQNFSFFAPEKLDSAIRFINLSDEVLEGDLNVVLERIVREVEEANPRIVVVDSLAAPTLDDRLRMPPTSSTSSWSTSRMTLRPIARRPPSTAKVVDGVTARASSAAAIVNTFMIDPIS